MDSTGCLEESSKSKLTKTLPPCRVCGQPAAGFHYGVNTCDACKGFFHRSLNLHKFYVCKHNETCQNKKGSKRMCRKCRYDRCVAAGMAKEAIKTGRYPASKHTSDILELQKLKHLETQQAQDNQAPSTDCCDASGFSSRCLQNLQKCPSYFRLKGKQDENSSFMLQCVTFLSQCGEGIQFLPDLKNRMQPSQKDSFSSAGTLRNFVDGFPLSSSGASFSYRSSNSNQTASNGHFQPSPMPERPSVSSNSGSFPLTPTSPSDISSAGSGTQHASSSESFSLEDFLPSPNPMEYKYEAWAGPSNDSYTYHDVEPLRDCSAQACASSTCDHCTSCGLPLNTVRVEELYLDKDHIIQVLMEARNRFLKPVSLQVSPERMDKMAADHLETCKMNAEMFGQPLKVPDAEYDFILASTGIDADNRRERYDVYLDFMEKMTRGVVKFSKAIPGFSQLSTAEKENLIKSGLGEVSYLNNYQNCRPESGVVCGPDNNLRCRIDTAVILDEPGEIMDWFDQTVIFTRALQRLCLSEEEETLINAIAIMSPDRGLFSPDQTAREIHEQLHECLIYHISRTRLGNSLLFYAKIIDCMVLARTVAHQYANVIKQINLPKYSLLQKNPLLREMMTGFVFGDYLEEGPSGDYLEEGPSGDYAVLS